MQKGLHKSSAGRYQKVTPQVQLDLRSKIESQFGPVLTSLPDHAWEYGLTFGVEAGAAHEVFKKLKDEKSLSFNMLIDITCVDWMDVREPRFEVVYQLLSISYSYRLCIKISVGEDKPEVDSVRDLWAAANFLEREVWDMYGVVFRNHGDLRRILMYDEFVGHPLRKDYPLKGKQPRMQLRIPELRNDSADMQREELVSLPSRSRHLFNKGAAN